MMTSVEAVVMLMMTSVEAVVMLMMMSAEAAVMLMMTSVEAVEVVVVVMAAATAYDTTRSADHLQTMSRLCARTPQAMLWRRQTCHLSHRWSRSNSCSNP
jgi:type IV secretory pathway VirB3-like protein